MFLLATKQAAVIDGTRVGTLQNMSKLDENDQPLIQYETINKFSTVYPSLCHIPCRD